MHKNPIIIVVLTAVVVLATAAAIYFGVMRERADLQWKARELDQTLSAEFAQNVRLAALLAGHKDVHAILTAQTQSKAMVDVLHRLAIATSRVAVVVVDTQGDVVASGLRNIQQAAPLVDISQSQRRLLTSNALGRRFVRDDPIGWMFETAKAVKTLNGDQIGGVFVYQSMEDIEQTWRALPENLTLKATDGRVLYQHRPFAPMDFAALKVEIPSYVHGTVLTLERDPRGLFLYALAGFFAGFATVLIAVLALFTLAKRQELTELRVEALAEDANRLEARVKDRTRALQSETEQHKQTAIALKDSQAQLEQAAKFKVLNDMARGLSHELSQPLFALQTNLDTLSMQMKQQSAKIPKPLDKAQGIAQRMGQILNNLKAFARKETVPAVATDLARVVGAALEILEYKMKQQNVHVDHQRPVQPVMGMASQTRLQQVIVNILSNSLDAVARDGHGAVVITYQTGRAGPVVRITDNGTGFKDVDAALTPFVTSKEDQNGLGLGLPISADIMHSFGGELQVSNLEEGGACVTLVFKDGAT